MPQRGWKLADTTVQASAHTGNLSPTVEQQISSTGRVAAAVIEIRQFPALAGFRRKLLSATKEVLKPKVSSGVFCILFVAADKKYAAGGNRESHSSETIGKSCCPLTTKKRALKPTASGLSFLTCIPLLPVQQLLIVRPQPLLLRIEGRQLAQIRSGEVVALDDSGTGRRDGHIPAHMGHLRDLMGRLLGQSNGLQHHGQLIAHELHPGVGMAVIDVEIVVGGGRDDLPRLRVHPAQDTPLPGELSQYPSPRPIFTLM